MQRNKQRNNKRQGVTAWLEQQVNLKFSATVATLLASFGLVCACMQTNTILGSLFSGHNGPSLATSDTVDAMHLQFALINVVLSKDNPGT